MSKPRPVAWITKGGMSKLWWNKSNESDMPLYIEPQKREWVGLTDDERVRITDIASDDLDAMMIAEAKLKEKNT
jgi:hypothetical protein